MLQLRNYSNAVHYGPMPIGSPNEPANGSNRSDCVCEGDPNNVLRVNKEVHVMPVGQAGGMQQANDQMDPHVRVRQLSEVGRTVEVDPTIPPKRYFRSGVEMARMANVYMEEANMENAFILYSKYITLFVEKLPKHPEYKNASPTDKINTKHKLKEIFPRAERIKAVLLEKYTREYDNWIVKKRQAEEEEELERRRHQVEEERRRKEEEERVLFDQHKNWVLNQQRLRPSDLLQNNMLHATGPTINAPGAPSNSPSHIFTKATLKPTVIAAAASDIGLCLVLPQVNRGTKPLSLLSPSQNQQQRLRAVSVPKSLMHSFLRLAQANTQRSIETCGILAGTLSHNSFSVTHLLIPQQTGTPDSCTTDNEEDLFAYQDQHDLITLGWIHTHPTQTAFMSSVDLHTHCSYQLMMPEAIAIVCSPKYQETGIYSLTQDYGVDYIANCRQAGFHPHPKEPPIYGDSQHVILDEMATVIVVDLRS